MSTGKEKKIKVLIVDDSALLRSVLTEIFNSDPRLEVVGDACDPYIAREKIKALNPDVITLDIEMPRMDGISFLKKIMRLRPMPVVMVSTLTEKGAPATLEALEIGAFDYIAKPKEGARALEEYSREIIEKVVAASKSRVRPAENLVKVKPKSNKIVSPASSNLLKKNMVLAIGASTGGTEAIKDVLADIPGDCPPIVISQHIPEVFSASFAKRLDSLCAMNVYEAKHGQPIHPGCAYLAPGHSHLKITKSVSGALVCTLDKGELVNRHRPSVEVMFDSVVKNYGKNVMGVLLTGMGMDGAAALLRMKQAGCITVVQDEASSVVWGMPGAAYKMGASDNVLALDKIAGFIIKQCYRAKAS